MGHGTIADGMKEAAEMIVGPQQGFGSLGLLPGDSLETYAHKLEEAVSEFENSNEVLIMADLPGGTPSNAALMLSLKLGVTCLAGSNLPLVLEILTCRDHMTIDELCQKSVPLAQSSIRNLTAELNSEGVIE